MAAASFIVRFGLTRRAARRWPTLPLRGLAGEGIRAGDGLLGGRPWARVEAETAAQAMAWVARFLPYGVGVVDARPALAIVPTLKKLS